MKEISDDLDLGMAQDGATFYSCKQCGTVLGVIQKENRRARLNVFRAYLSRSQITLDYVREIKSYSVINLEQGTVICGLCGARPIWRMSEAALDELISRRKKRYFGLEKEGAS